MSIFFDLASSPALETTCWWLLRAPAAGQALRCRVSSPHPFPPRCSPGFPLSDLFPYPLALIPYPQATTTTPGTLRPLLKQYLACCSHQRQGNHCTPRGRQDFSYPHPPPCSPLLHPILTHRYLPSRHANPLHPRRLRRPPGPAHRPRLDAAAPPRAALARPRARPRHLQRRQALPQPPGHGEDHNATATHLTWANMTIDTATN